MVRDRVNLLVLIEFQYARWRVQHERIWLRGA